MLEMSGIRKHFGATIALDGVDFAISPGEVHALLGENGAGKSTLMKVLGGLYPSDAGEITLDGEVLDLSDPKAALNAGIGMVYQEFDLAPDLSVAENILLGHETSQRIRRLPVSYLSRRQLKEQASSLLAEYGFDDLAPGQRVGNLPVGARQLTQVSKALALDSRVVVFDEPTARLTSHERERLFKVIRRLADAGKMIVFISHYLEEVLEISDRVTVLRDGRSVAEERASELSIEDLTRLMVGHDNLSDVAVSSDRRPVQGDDIVFEVDGLTSEPHFRDISFQVRAGEIFGIAGIIGSGRHELTRALIGALKSSGRIRLATNELHLRNPAQAVREGIGFVPEDRRLEGVVPDRTIEQNLSLAWLDQVASFGVLRGRKIRQRATDLIKRTGVRCSGPSQPVWQLSGGNQQKVVLGRWFGADVPVVVMEAPTVGVDIVATEEIHNQIRELASAGRAIIISSDDLRELEHVADRIMIMVRGNVTQTLDAHSASHDQFLGALGVG